MLKPTEARNGVGFMQWLAGLVDHLDGDPSFRVAPYVRTSSGELVLQGWTATWHAAGEHRPGRWTEVLQVAEVLHDTMVGLPAPPIERHDKWAHADRCVWGAAPWPADCGAVIEQARAALRTIDAAPQLVHGDLTGNVLFADDAPPLVLDFSLYWRPRRFASAIVVVDALTFHGASATLIRRMPGRDPAGQFLVRALLFRALTDVLGGAAPDHVDATYAHVLEPVIAATRSGRAVGAQP